MALYEFKLPDIGEGVAEGEVVKWFIAEGDAIREDAPLVSVLTDKANVEIPSPKTGRIAKLHAREGEKVKVGGLLVSIETGEPGAAGAAPAAATPATTPTATSDRTAPATVTRSPAPGVAPPAADAGARILATPFVRRLAAEKGIDLSQIRGSGPNGRITEEDLAKGTSPSSAPVASTERSAPTGSPQRPSPANGSPPVRPAASATDVDRIPIRGIRRVIAEHMAESTHRAAHFTYVEEIDATELMRTRDRMARHLEKQGVKLTYLPFIIKAVAAGLREHPNMNATMDDERQELIVHHRHDIGIALAGPEGLIVPVLRGVDHKSVAAIARELQDLGERGRAGKLTRDELTGSTFTITSLGALGGVLATPILNYPEVAILGVHRIVKRPIYNAEGELVPAQLMNLSVSLDHRVLDGITGAQFLATVKAQLEDPHVLFAELA
jgi:pyruvate dehydrogenase E2 component (dihydrolipoamide acetyltransferase)